MIGLLTEKVIPKSEDCTAFVIKVLILMSTKRGGYYYIFPLSY